MTALHFRSFAAMMWLTAFLLSSSGLFAQDYRLFNHEEDVYYQLHHSLDCYSECYVSAAPMQIFENSNDTTLIFKRVLKGNALKTNYTGVTCSTFRDTSYFGERVIIKDNHTHLIVNGQGDTITIMPQLAAGQTWTAYHYINNNNTIEGRVDSVSYSLVGTEMDSVKHLSFAIKDSLGNVTSFPIGQFPVLLSKHYGLVRSFAWYDFPNNYLTYLTLAGHERQPDAEIYNITWKQIYDYNVGDEMHLYKSDAYDGYGRQFYIKDIILTKDSTATHWLYQIEREQALVKYDPIPSVMAFDTTYSKDTISRSYAFSHYADTIQPRERFSNSNSKWTLARHPDERRVQKTMNWGFDGFMMSDSCLAFTTGMTFPDTVFIEGLGGGYYSWWHNLVTYSRLLRYYKKGDLEWGNPIKMEIYSTTTHVAQQPKALFIQPNPAREVVRVQTLPVMANAVLKVYDMNGQLIMRQNLSPNNDWLSLNINHWSAGVYVVRIVGSDAVWQGRVLKQ